MSYRRTYVDKRFSHTITTDAEKIPRYTNLAAVGDEPGMEGDIILDRETKQFCFHTGEEWKCLDVQNTCNNCEFEILQENIPLVIDTPGLYCIKEDLYVEDGQVGITVNSNNVTLDGCSQLITGTASGTTELITSTATGILVTATATENVIIFSSTGNGLITGLNIGISLQGAAKITDIIFSRNATNIAVGPSSNGTIINNNVFTGKRDDNSDGITITDNSSAVIDDNIIRGMENGIYIDQTSTASITRNVISASATGINAELPSPPPRVGLELGYNIVENNDTNLSGISDTNTAKIPGDFVIAQHKLPIVITEPGVYTLIESLTVSDGMEAITVQSDNVTINLQDYKIAGPTFGSTAFVIRGNNCMIKGGDVYDFNILVDYADSSGLTISNTRFANSLAGLVLGGESVQVITLNSVVMDIVVFGVVAGDTSTQITSLTFNNCSIISNISIAVDVLESFTVNGCTFNNSTLTLANDFVNNPTIGLSYKNVVIKNSEFYTSRVSLGNIIDVDVIDNIFSYDQTSAIDIIALDDCRQCDVNGNRIYSTVPNNESVARGIVCTQIVTSFGNLRDHNFIGNSLSNLRSGILFRLSPLALIGTPQFENITISGCNFKNISNDAVFTFTFSRNITITDCVVEGAATEVEVAFRGFYIGGVNVEVSGCKAINTVIGFQTQDTAPEGTFFVDNTRNIIIQGCSYVGGFDALFGFDIESKNVTVQDCTTQFSPSVSQGSVGFLIRSENCNNNLPATEQSNVIVNGCKNNGGGWGFFFYYVVIDAVAPAINDILPGTANTSMYGGQGTARGMHCWNCESSNTINTLARLPALGLGGLSRNSDFAMRYYLYNNATGNFYGGSAIYKNIWPPLGSVTMPMSVTVSDLAPIPGTWLIDSVSLAGGNIPAITFLGSADRSNFSGRYNWQSYGL